MSNVKNDYTVIGTIAVMGGDDLKKGDTISLTDGQANNFRGKVRPFSDSLPNAKANDDILRLEGVVTDKENTIADLEADIKTLTANAETASGPLQAEINQLKADIKVMDADALEAKQKADGDAQIIADLQANVESLTAPDEGDKVTKGKK